jgi:hypothetical protein
MEPRHEVGSEWSARRQLTLVAPPALTSALPGGSARLATRPNRLRETAVIFSGREPAAGMGAWRDHRRGQPERPWVSFHADLLLGMAEQLPHHGPGCVVAHLARGLGR